MRVPGSRGGDDAMIESMVVKGRRTRAERPAMERPVRPYHVLSRRWGYFGFPGL